MKVKHANYFIICFYHFIASVSASTEPPLPHSRGIIIKHFDRCLLTFQAHCLHDTATLENQHREEYVVAHINYIINSLQA